MPVSMSRTRSCPLRLERWGLDFLNHNLRWYSVICVFFAVEWSVGGGGGETDRQTEREAGWTWPA